MKLATTTGDFDRFCEDYLERVQHVYEAGFRYIDLSLYTIRDEDPLLVKEDWKTYAERMSEYAKERGIQFVQAHGPNTNPLKSEEDFEQAVTVTIRAIEVCGALGIPNMVIHSGWNKEAEKEECFRRNAAFFHRLIPTMEACNVNVLHENTTSINIRSFYPKSGAQMREFSEYVNHPKVHSCWDIGHAKLEGPQYEDIMTMGEDLYALHIHDNVSRDEHIIPFMGTINMDEVMHALIDVGYKGYFTMEAGSVLRPARYWLGCRAEFEKDTRLLEPPLELQKELERFMYKTGEYILKTYGVFEE